MDSDIDPTTMFSCGLELASLAVSSNLLSHSWDAISELQSKTGSSPETPRYSISDFRNYEIVAFVASAVPEGSDLVLSSDIPDFKFLCSKRNPEFSISRAARDLFDSLRAKLASLKAQVVGGAKNTMYLITGHSLGGLVASLFTLWMLDALNPTTTKRPLCITFGSPLLGDLQFQQAISRDSAWNSRFLHTIHRDDPFSGIFPTPKYQPFGTFLFLSGSGKACFEAPEWITELLERMNPERNGNQHPQGFDYGPTIARLRDSIVSRDATELSWRENDSYKSGINAQLTAIGLLQNEQQEDNWVKKTIAKLEKEAINQKREMSDPAKKLSEVKVNMAQLEWYKKLSENDSPGYYDCYKTKRIISDHTAVKYKRILTDYWERMVEEVERKPQNEGAHFRKRWFYSGTNFRRMVEPLEIAEHYQKVQEGNVTDDMKDYRSGRLNCYTKLEKWLNEDKKPEISLVARKQTIKSSLTEDSCFWAHVEEAVISCKAYHNGDDRSFRRLQEFELYVFGLIKRYAVSPEIFIPESSYMMWWKEYDGILSSRLIRGQKVHGWKFSEFMRKGRYHQYKEGNYDPMDDDE